MVQARRRPNPITEEAERIIEAARPKHPKIHPARTATKAKFLIFGPSKVGKTHFIGTGIGDPRLDPILFLMCDPGGDVTLARHAEDVWDVTDIDDVSEAYNYLAEGDHPFASVVIDSFSRLNWESFDSVVQSNVAKSKEKDDREIERNINTAEKGDYGDSRNQTLRVLYRFLSLPMHVFLVADMQEQINSKSARITKPSFNGKLANEVPAAMNLVGYYDFKPENDRDYPGRRYIQLSHPTVRVGARTPWGESAPEELIEPTLSELLDACGY